MNAKDTALAVAHTSSGAETLAKKVPKAHVVSAFSTVPSEVLFDVFRRKRRTRRRPSLLFCGDDRLRRRSSGSSRCGLPPLGLSYGGRWFEKHAVARHRRVGALTAVEAAGRPLS